jgi:hypothetical protein
MQQFRFRKQHGRLAIHWEATPLGEINIIDEAAASVSTRVAPVACDMVRVMLETLTSGK